MNSYHIIKHLTLVFLIISSFRIYSQNTQCSSPTPFCTGVPMNFPAGTSGTPAQVGPNYDCLFSQPNPAWFFMQIATSGPITVVISAANDVDFISWGPFPSLTSTVNGGPCNNLNSTNEVPTGNGSNGCSYSASATETLIIPNAVAGQVYLLLVTNYSQQAQTINLTQTNSNVPGAGQTDCSIICTVTPVSSGPICPGGTATISATTGTSVNTYTWTGPGGFSSTTTLTNVITNVTSSQTYTLQGTTSTSTCQAVTTITVVPLPNYTLTPQTTTICQNGSFIAVANSTNPSEYNYQWSGPVGFSSPNGGSTLVNPPGLPVFTQTALVTYSIVVTPTILNCPVSKTLSVLINNPSTPTLAMPPPLCNTSTVTVVTATPGTGTWFGNQIVNALGVVSPNTATVFGTYTVGYIYSIGACTASNVGNISISQYNSAALTSTVPGKCVQDAPVNLLATVLNTLGVWSGVGVSNNYFNPANLPTGSYLLTYYNPSTPYPGVCPATNTMAISVFNPPVPVISPITPKCTNSPTIALSVVPAGGVWSGNPGISAGGIQSPGLSTNVVGTNTVLYTAGQGTCLASSSATFHVDRFYSAALSTYSMDICVSTNPIDLMSLVSNTVNGSWSSPNPSLVTGSYTFDPSGLATAVYTLNYNTYSFPNPLQCPDTRALHISVLHPQQPYIALVNPVCSVDAPFQLSVNPATGSFVPSLYLSATGLYTPSLSAVGANPVQYVIGTSTCNATDTKLVTVEAFVPATIIGSVPDQCNTNQVVSLIPLTANNLGSWIGPGVLGTSFNPAQSGIGSIALYYNTASFPSGLCPDQQTLAVNVYSLASPSIGQQGPYCNSQAPVRLNVSPLGGIFSASSTGAIDAGGWFNPAFARVGPNIITYSVSSGPCQAYAQSTINVEAFVAADFSQYAGPFCKNDSPLDLSSIVVNPGGIFSGPGVNNGIFTPANANIGNNNMITYQTHSYPDQDLCPDQKSIQIQVNATPVVSIVRDVTQGCEPVQVTFNTPNVNTGQGSWNLGDGSDPQSGLTVVHTYTAPGTYSVVFNYKDPIGCSTQTAMSNAVKVFEVPNPAFTYVPYQEVTVDNPEVQFFNQTPKLGASTYKWQMDNLYSTTEVSPKALFQNAGEYLITLTATNVDGCLNSVSQRLIVKADFSVFIPNSFTPNFDGLNDVFIPVFSPFGIDPNTYDMEIFDRWDNSLFHTTDITKGWDGTRQNKGGDPLKQEVYIYKIKYKDTQGKIYNRIGSVTLLR